MNNDDNENINDNNNENYYDSLLDNCSTNMLKLKYNNCDNPQYEIKDQKFINENKYITNFINKTKLYKDFPSKTREEFNEKKNISPKSLLKNSKYQGKVVLTKKFGREEDNNDKLIKEDYLQHMWKRSIHEDAYKLNE